MSPLKPNFNPAVLIFDLDETIHALFKKNDINPSPVYCTQLSSSTEKLLCNEPNGQCFWYKHPYTDNDYYMHAIAREEFKKIFDRIYEMKQAYRENCPIAVKVMTRGEFYVNEIKQAWDKFYGDGDERFMKDLFPLEIFNRSSFKRHGVTIHKDEEDKEFKKDELMSEHFPRWQEEQPGLEKGRVCLLDDNYDTIVKVKECGFTALHFPTHFLRPENSTFTEEGPKAFAAIHHLIDTAAPERYTERCLKV